MSGKERLFSFGARDRSRQSERPTLRSASSTRRVDALFKAMSTDFLLREQFVTDPAQVTSEYVHGTQLAPERASAANQLLYAVMSNPGLLSWLREYAGEHADDPPSNDEFVRDFGRAVVDNGGSQVVLALIRSEREDVFGSEDSLLALILGTLVQVDPAVATEMSTGTYATEQSGTHMSTGAVMSTEMSTGTYATEQSGTHMSTGAVMSTEMSTGTYATEQSGTHMSTGHSVLEGLGTQLGYQRVTLEALVEHATRLRDSGALDAVWEV